MRHRLTKQAKELIRKNNALSTEIANELGIQTNSIGPAMHRNTVGLISLPVLDKIKEHTGIDVHDLIEEVSTDAALAVTTN